ncbi:MAG: hypothetical protein N2234_06825 [Planctomycetota bacterium]|nr:hypothetical protein [Planctomycetota bacterium]
MRMKTLEIVAVVSVFVCSCSVTLKDLKAPLILPPDVSPLYAVALFRLAVSLGEYDAAYALLTEKTKKEMGYWKFRTLLQFNLSIPLGEQEVAAYDFITGAKTIGLIEREDENIVDVGFQWENIRLYLYVGKEGEFWRIGFYETALGY